MRGIQMDFKTKLSRRVGMDDIREILFLVESDDSQSRNCMI